MPWDVEFHDDFVGEYRELPEEVQDELQARVDTLNGSRHKNMKELRFEAGDGVWRFAFAFDPNRQGIILCGGDKSGSSESPFYKRIIVKADARFSAHCTAIKKGKKRS